MPWKSLIKLPYIDAWSKHIEITSVEMISKSELQ